MYSVRLLQQLVASAVPVELTVSEAGCRVIQQELGIELDSDQIQIDAQISDSGCQPLEFSKTSTGISIQGSDESYR